MTEPLGSNIRSNDRIGGDRNIIGNIVEVIDCWFNVRVDSLGEEPFTSVGRSGIKDKNKSVVKLPQHQQVKTR
ncbi:hypothetical protein SAMN06295926_14412 [Lysinibacillus sp. AC-3]|uniref:hypothetical protein n=1 Tax=unclassified Lysinibacillus TaxID=2636778 RepID=UPI0009CFD30C|nr:MULTISPECIES: hypothetical protein [unclassified Lysinibacillus]SKC19521.1 hypothetical protein SAMN06295926_14412 [Lysinibacillus sp. AC-3]